MVIYAGHVISILIFLAVIASATYMAATLKTSTLPPCYLWVPKVVIYVLVMQATIFLLLQAEYFLGDHEVLESSTRVLYDICAGLALVTFSTALNVFFRWKHTGLNCPISTLPEKL